MIRGYNGFQSIFSELEETMNDLPKRKYPLELEKAIYNVMFIQNHMQRLDEFNAVSVFIIQKKNGEKIF